ncbi:protein FAM13A isoform X3 [Pseudoliparis swirei]|uniref:protein FAM13A isoform X3 n=1 Tax=Pseudoliparis swirei TaxID=2059687 RepID=UPI0024BD7311|nr:protein FAM13A isoform X3 [Pseudoliparis swirei]
MGAGALTICHNKTAVQVKEDMKKMVQIPMLRPMTFTAKYTKLFGVSLFELQEKGLMEDGVPLVLRRMVDHLRKHALHQEGLFRVNGNVRAVETLKQRLESGEDVDLLSESDSCTVASLLKRYLRDLPMGLVDSRVQQALIQHHQECGDDVSDMRALLQQLPDIHHRLLRYLCHFLTLVECNHEENRMTALNLATVFGPSVFHVAPGYEAMKDQNICNKIMFKFIQNYSNIFQIARNAEGCTEERPTPIIVKEVDVTDADTKKSISHLRANPPTPIPRTKREEKETPQHTDLLNKSSTNVPQARQRKKKVRKGTSDRMTVVIPDPSCSPGSPHARSLSIPIILPLTSVLRSHTPEPMETARQETPDTASPLNHSSGDMEAISSNHRSPVHFRPDVGNCFSSFSFLDRTIRSSVEQHLFDGNPVGDESSEDCERLLRPRSPRATTPSARQRRRRQREQQEEGQRHKERNGAASVRADTNKENIPLSGGSSSGSVAEDTGGGVDSQEDQSGHAERTPKPRKCKHSPTLVQLTDNQDAHTFKEGAGERPGVNHMETFDNENDISRKDGISSPQQTFRMKIQESPVTCDTGRVGGGEVRGSDPDHEDVPRLDLTALTEENNRGEPYPQMQRESMDREEARLSPHAGGRLIRQLIEEDSDPMLSPRFYAYGQCQQYLDDTEVPPSPPNAHSFMSRRRSSSLGSCDDEKEELTSAQLTKRIHVLRKKIHRFEERFEEERKYRPSHSDKAGNPEVLRWANELSKLRKELKENKLMMSEEDLPPLTRQRSNTLPRSFGSQLEKKPQQEKVPKPPVESSLETILKKLQEKREEVNRPEDIKDMTREQIGAEKVALQKALLYYESIHGRPVTKSERQIMKPLYDRYRLVKQILCRASTIPVIEEEDGSEEEGDSKIQFNVTERPDVSVLGFLDHLAEEGDGFISPVDELSPSKNTTDMRLSNLHSATTEELVEQLQETREEKKRLRKNLKEFEEQFFRQNGRNVQKEDRSPLAVEYNEYKHVKAKLRLLEVLISKRDSTKLI